MTYTVLHAVPSAATYQHLRLASGVPETGYVSLLADVPADALYAQFGFVPTAPRTVGMAWRRPG